MSQRIALVSGSYWPREGGAERQLRMVLGSLAATHDVEVVVVTRVVTGCPRESIDPRTGVRILRVGSLRLLSKDSPLGKLTFLLSALAQLWRIRPQAIISVQFGSASAAAAAFACGFRTRHFVRLTGGGTKTQRSEPLARAATLWGRMLVRHIARKRTLVVAPAHHLMEDFLLAFPDSPASVVVVPNGVPDPVPARIPALAERLGIVWYARGGTEQSWSVFKDIACECEELQFLVVGVTAASSDLPKNVRILGWVDNVYDVLASSRVLLNTSRTEGSPNMALQALAVGCAVVGPPNRGLMELSQQYPHGVHLVDVNSPSLTRAALLEVHGRGLEAPLRVTSQEEATDRWGQLLELT